MTAFPCALLTALIAASLSMMSCDSPRDPRKPPQPVTASAASVVDRA